MGKLTVTKTKLTDVLILEPAVFGDHRGFFTESYSQADFQEAGITQTFVQDNHSLSVEAGVLRGLHFQKGTAAQTKLIRVVTGAVLDVIVDIRKGSPTYGEWEGYILSESNQRQVLYLMILIWRSIGPLQKKKRFFRKKTNITQL